MALKDDLQLTTVTSAAHVLLLDGEGVITNMSDLNIDLKFRFDTSTPDKSAVARTLPGADRDKQSFENTRADTKIYGIAKNKDVQILVSREV